MALQTLASNTGINLGDAIPGKDESEQIYSVSADGEPICVLVQSLNATLNRSEGGPPSWTFAVVAYRTALQDMLNTETVLNEASTLAEAVEDVLDMLGDGKVQKQVLLDPENSVYVPHLDVVLDRQEVLDVFFSRGWELSGNAQDGQDLTLRDGDVAESRVDLSQIVWPIQGRTAEVPVLGSAWANPRIPHIDDVDTQTLPTLVVDFRAGGVHLTPPKQSLQELLLTSNADVMAVVEADGEAQPLDEPIQGFADFLVQYRTHLLDDGMDDSADGQDGLDGMPVDRLGIWVADRLDPHLHVIIDNDDGHPWAALRGEVWDFLNSERSGGDAGGSPESLFNKDSHLYERLLDSVPPIKGADTNFELTEDDWNTVGFLQRVDEKYADGKWFWSETLLLDDTVETCYAYERMDVARTLNTIWGTAVSDVHPDTIRKALGLLTEPAGGMVREANSPEQKGDVIREWRFPDGSRVEEVLGEPWVQHAGVDERNHLKMYCADGRWLSSWVMDPSEHEPRENWDADYEAPRLLSRMEAATGRKMREEEGAVLPPQQETAERTLPVAGLL